jgi:hypothetical protein
MHEKAPLSRGFPHLVPILWITSWLHSCSPGLAARLRPALPLQRSANVERSPSMSPRSRARRSEGRRYVHVPTITATSSRTDRTFTPPRGPTQAADRAVSCPFEPRLTSPASNEGRCSRAAGPSEQLPRSVPREDRLRAHGEPVGDLARGEQAVIHPRVCKMGRTGQTLGPRARSSE